MRVKILSERPERETDRFVTSVIIPGRVTVEWETSAGFIKAPRVSCSAGWLVCRFWESTE